MGILYLCTMGLAFVGVVIDLIAICIMHDGPVIAFCCNVGRIKL